MFSILRYVLFILDILILGQQRAPPRAAGIAESMGRKGRGIVLGGDIVSGLARYLRDVV